MRGRPTRSGTGGRPLAPPSAATPASAAALDRWAFPCLAAFIFLMSACHLYYALFSRVPPSTDEAHYMSGALSMANGIRTGTLRGAWEGYQNALGFKAPLVCVPAALLMLTTGGLILPAMLSLVGEFAALGLAAYWLFLRCVRPFQAAVAAALLLTMPLITGLTHRYYVELLFGLLGVVYVGLLIREPWRSPAGSLLVGVVLGLGALCKISFGAFVSVPTAFSLGAAVLLHRRKGLAIIGNAALAGAAAAAVAGSWYAKNWAATLHHARISTETSAATEWLYYPHWIQADLSAGPGVIIFVVALAGATALSRQWRSGLLTAEQRKAWRLVLLPTLTSIVLLSSTINKMTRYTVLTLPAAALLAVVAWPEPGSKRWSRYGMIALVAVCSALALHISFGILPLGEVRIGDIRIIGSHFPLNVPDWYEDNRPLDRRNFRLEEAEAIIARDARTRLPGRRAEARTTVLNLLVDHDYFQVLAALHQSPVNYTWWPGSTASGPQAPDYILGFEGFESVCPGREFHNYYPGLKDDVSSGRVPYTLLAELDGPVGASISIYAKQPAAPEGSRAASYAQPGR